MTLRGQFFAHSEVRRVLLTTVADESYDPLGQEFSLAFLGISLRGRAEGQPFKDWLVALTTIGVSPFTPGLTAGSNVNPTEF